MDAIVELGDFGDSIPQLELNEVERQLLESIDQIYHERVFATPSDEEEAVDIYEKMIAGERIRLTNNFDNKTRRGRRKWPLINLITVSYFNALMFTRQDHLRQV